jgi:hypothetical protein
MTVQSNRKEIRPLKDYEEFQRHTYDNGGQVPLFQYANLNKPNKSMRSSARFVGLCGLSAIIILIGIATERYVILSILLVIGLWLVVDRASKRGGQQCKSEVQQEQDDA